MEGNPKQPAFALAGDKGDKIGGGIPFGQGIWLGFDASSGWHRHTTEVGGFRLPKKEV